MNDIKLLDCTLRDGGYVNDWEFGHDNLLSIFERQVDAGVDVIEVGFLDERRPFDINRSIMPDTKSVAEIWGSVKQKPEAVFGMVDYGTCAIENIQPCEESFLDGIRVIFKQHLLKEALEYCAQIKALGYKVCAQLVSVTTYSDEDLLDMVRQVNEVEPYAVGMVDTYGLLDPEKLLHIYDIIDRNLKPEINIGFHAHNNFQLAFANSRAFLEKERQHTIIVDGTLYGMGKSAGNAPIELVAMELNRKYGKSYDIDSMLESIDESVMDFYETSPWGYKMFFYLAAKNECHPNYVNFFMKKDTLSLSDLDSTLEKIEPQPKKLLYDKDIAENLYETYEKAQGDDAEDYERLSKALNGKKVLLIGPGKNIQLQKNRVDEFINREHPIVISVNYVPGAFDVDYVFVTKPSRYRQMTNSLAEIKNKNVQLIATSNLKCRAGEFFCRVNRAQLLEPQEQFKDNSFLMMLKVLNKAGIKQVWCAGFDGYSSRESNYFNPSMEYEFVKAAASQLNRHMHGVIFEEHKDMDVQFITFSYYTEVEDMNYAGI